jgi:hypothetical protein
MLTRRGTQAYRCSYVAETLVVGYHLPLVDLLARLDRGTLERLQARAPVRVRAAISLDAAKY